MACNDHIMKYGAQILEQAEAHGSSTTFCRYISLWHCTDWVYLFYLKIQVKLIWENLCFKFPWFFSSPDCHHWNISQSIGARKLFPLSYTPIFQKLSILSILDLAACLGRCLWICCLPVCTTQLQNKSRPNPTPIEVNS